MKFDSSAWNPHPHTSVSPKEMGVSSDSFAPSRNSYSGSAHLTTLRNFVRRSLSSTSATTITGLSSGYDTEPRLRPAETFILISIEQRDSMTLNYPQYPVHRVRTYTVRPDCKQSGLRRTERRSGPASPDSRLDS